MKCEDVLMALQRTADVTDIAQRAAAEHLGRCEECRTAAHALAVLRADRDLPIPVPDDDAFERAVASAAASTAAPSGRLRVAHPRRTFWLGVGVGAMAAALAIAAIGLRERPDETAPAARAPEVTLALNQVRAVSVALNSPEPLANAEISIVLRGDVGLRGFGEQRELRWFTDLDRGSNQLTLPLVALGAGSGQVLVQVQHGEKRRAFVVDVRTVGDPEARSLDPHAEPGATDASAVI